MYVHIYKCILRLVNVCKFIWQLYVHIITHNYACVSIAHLNDQHMFLSQIANY